ncbi:MAG TPA: DUF6328 family protein [Candidatus Binatia bacterium]|nr:DUF6328 family protein [Candidatus Binatia bacterium]
MADESGRKEEDREIVPLSRAAQYLLEECRMVLPGIQALFGFQLVVVFNPGFSQKLSESQQQLHLVAVALIACAIALIMAPAAYHRQRGPQQVTGRFIRLASNLLLASMVPLAVGICIEFYLVGHVIYPGPLIRVAAGTLFALIVILWFVVPRIRRD